MADPLQLDPQWAWEPFVPDEKQPWDRRLAAHLLRRAGFGATSTQVDEAVAATPSQVVQQMLTLQSEDFEKDSDAFAKVIASADDAEKLSAAWCYRLLFTPNQALEKTTLFWHGHFATSIQKVEDTRLMWEQNRLLRRHALGDFGALAHGIAQDPAMLVYLDSTTNRKSHPNENFARELMELFCLGEGHYSEADVQELARCFTGWEIRNRKFRKNKYQQDRGEKKVLGREGRFDGEQGVDIVIEQDAMPDFICRKLVRYFVCDEPELSASLVAPLATYFRESELNVRALLARVLTSNLFFSPYAFARKIRSPSELTVGLLRSLECTTNTNLLAKGLKTTGQGLYYPPNVKGWDGGRTWINSSLLLSRANLVGRLLTDEKTRFAEGDLASFFEKKNVGQSEVVDWLADMLCAIAPGPAAKQELNRTLSSGQGSLDERLRRTVHAMATLPEFQLG